MVIATIGALLCAGCASKSKVADEEPPPEPSSGALGSGAADVELMEEVGPDDDATATAGSDESGDEHTPDPCEQDDTEGWLDGTQEWVYETTCRTAMWFDGFFGNARYDERTGETHGRVGLSGFWDQRDGFDPSLRFRAKFALPSARNRASLMIGRGDEQEMIEERTTQMDTVPGNFTRIDDDSFLVGLGFASDKRPGFKLSVGAKVRWPPEPYVKLRYRKHFALTESTLLSLRPILYWRSEEKLGTTLHVDLDQMLNEHLMLRWANFGNVAQDEVQGLEWESSLILFQALSNRRAMTYRALVVGETKAEETLNNYGFELRYRQRVLREWLFVEFITGITWPKYFADEEREANIGIGAGFEMYFGPTPEGQMY
ncbi:MAG: hypothetical protein KJO13_02625 [Gammaproteobacteria bacterium]|nr:hypothetical protein [Gammaproteobacteria bacterium]